MLIMSQLTGTEQSKTKQKKNNSWFQVLWPWILYKGGMDKDGSRWIDFSTINVQFSQSALIFTLL